MEDEQKAIAVLFDGTEVEGVLTTDHPASSYGHPVFVDQAGDTIDAWLIQRVVLIEASEL